MHCYNHISTSKTGRHETTPVWKGLPTQHDSQSGWVLHANVSCHRRLAHYIRAAVWKATVTLDEFEFFPVFNECFYLCLFPSLQAVVCSLCSQMNRMNFERALTTTCTWTHLAVAATSTSSLWLRKQPSASPPRFRCSRINRLIRPPWGECDRCCQHEWETQLREKHTVRIAQCEKATEIVAPGTESGRDGDNGYMAGGGEENVFFFFLIFFDEVTKGKGRCHLTCFVPVLWQTRWTRRCPAGCSEPTKAPAGRGRSWWGARWEGYWRTWPGPLLWKSSPAVGLPRPVLSETDGLHLSCQLQKYLNLGLIFACFGVWIGIV